MKKPKWFATHSGITHPENVMGPFDTQMEASKVLMNADSMPSPGSFVWPAEIDATFDPETLSDNGNTTSDTLPYNVVPRSRNYKVQSI
jgi:hypothetical protein